VNFKESLERKRQAAKSEPQTTAPAEMTEAELDQELERARADLRRLKEEELAATREATASPARPRFLPNKRSRRPYWK
jgi:hypothetical protein